MMPALFRFGEDGNLSQEWKNGSVLLCGYEGSTDLCFAMTVGGRHCAIHQDRDDAEEMLTFLSPAQAQQWARCRAERT